jgi:flagellar hook-basal body complex protein FliE
VSGAPIGAADALTAPLSSNAQRLAPELSTFAAASTADSVGGGAFDALVQQIQSLSNQMSSSAPQVAALALRQSDGLETVLLNLERSRVQFDVLMSVRNRLLEAYQDLMRMQV